MVNDSEDCSGVISSTRVTELFTVFSPRERLFGIGTNVNCESALTHQIPRISLSDPAPLNILHSTKAKPRTPKYKEASYITGNYQRAPEGHTHLPWKIDRHDAKRRPTRSHCSKGTGWRLANWSELPRPRRHQVCHQTVHVASVLRGYA